MKIEGSLWIVSISHNKKMMGLGFLMLEIEFEWSPKFEYPKINGRCHKFGYCSSYITIYSFTICNVSCLLLMTISPKSKIYMVIELHIKRNFLSLIVHHYQQITSITSYQVDLQILEYLQGLRRVWNTTEHTSLPFRIAWFEQFYFF